MSHRVGTIPSKIDKERSIVEFAGVELQVSLHNYTDLEEFEGYYPVAVYWDGRTIEAESGTVTIENAKKLTDDMVKAFEEGKLDTSRDQPLGVDTEHVKDKDNPTTEVRHKGYVIDVKSYQGKLRVFNGEGDLVESKVPENSIYMMYKIGWLSEGQELLRSGSKPYFSIVYYEKDGQGYLGSPTLTARPADKEIPPVVKFEAESPIKIDASQEEVILDEKKKELIAFIEAITDEAILAQLYDAVMAKPEQELEKKPETNEFETRFKALEELVKAQGETIKTLQESTNVEVVAEKAVEKFIAQAAKLPIFKSNPNTEAVTKPVDVSLAKMPASEFFQKARGEK